MSGELFFCIFGMEAMDNMLSQGGSKLLVMTSRVGSVIAKCSEATNGLHGRGGKLFVLQNSPRSEVQCCIPETGDIEVSLDKSRAGGFCVVDKLRG